jgi:hypothetical protein
LHIFQEEVSGIVDPYIDIAFFAPVPRATQAAKEKQASCKE